MPRRPQVTTKPCIYRIFFEGNIKNYIGLAKNGNDRRNNHLFKLNKRTHRNCHLQNAFNKYGQELFRFEVVQLCELSELSELEVFYIAKYKSDDRRFGYNIAPGGFRPIISAETRKKMSERMKGKPISEEEKHRLRTLNIGRKASEETKEKMRIIMAGKNIWNNDQRKIISERMQGNKHGAGKVRTDEWRKMISENNKGNKHGLGRIVTDEVKLKIREKRLGKPIWNEEQRKIISERNKKYKVSDENKKKIGEASKRLWEARRSGLKPMPVFSEQGIKNRDESLRLYRIQKKEEMNNLYMTALRNYLTTL
jgi:group I intron endonuclease